jgi:predicted Zn-dependent peptidase
MEVSAVRSLGSNVGLAAHLGEAWAVTGDWRFDFRERRMVRTVAAEEVVAAAKRYLLSPYCTVAWLVLGEGPAFPSPVKREHPARQSWEAN